MKRKFTRLTAALALLVGLAIPMGMWGQTRDTQTVSYGWETTDDADPWTISTAIVATSGQGNTGTYAGKISSNSTTVQFNEKVYVTSFSYAFKRTSTNNNYSVYIETSTDGSTWSIKDTQAMNTFQNGTYRTVTKEFDGTQELYVRFRCNNTTAVRYVDDVTITYVTSAAQLEPCDLTLTNASTSIVFDLYNNSDPYVINYTTSSTGEVTVADSDYITAEVDQTNKTITVTPVAVTNGAKVVTVNQAADENYAAGSKTFTINITDSTPFSGGDVTFDATVDKDLDNTTQGEGSITKNGVTFECNNGILGNGTEYRMYKNSTTTFSVSEGTITQIVFTGTSSNPASGFATQTGWTTNGNNGTWTGNAEEVSFTASGAQVRATMIVVTVETGGTPAPSITAENVSIEYNAESGSIAYTINNEPDPAGTLTAAVKEGTTPTIASFTLGSVTSTTVPFICSANNSGTARTAVVTLTYTYGEEETTTDVTITQAADPNYVMTITEARAQATGSTVITKGVVTSIVGNNAYIQDATAAICVYGNSDHPLTSINVGDEIKVSGTLTNYNNLLEITNPTCTVLTTGNTVTPTVMTIAEINESTNQGWFIKIESATVGETSSGNTTLTQSGSSIVARNLSGATQGDVINLTGNISVYNTTKQIANPLVVLDPTIIVDENQITLSYQVGATQAPQETLIVEGSNLEGDVTVSLTQTGNFFKISEDATTWGTEDITLTPTSGTLEESMIGVMMNTGLGLGTYEGTITLTSANASTVTVSLTGTVTNQTYAINLTQPTMGGTIAADKATAEAGQTVTLTATPATGYEFGSWTVLKNDLTTEVEVNNNQFVMPDCEVLVSGSFSQIDYTITLAPTTNGTVECESQTANYGEEVLVTVTPATGYRVQSFTVTETNGQGTVTDIEEASGLYSFDMPAYNVTITVVFATGYTSGIFNKINSLDDLEDGAYYVIYDTKAMNSTLSSGTMGATAISPEGTVFNNPPAAVVWKLEANGTNWNLYNEVIDEYCFINGNSTSSFATGETSTYSYTVTAPSQGEFTFKSTHTNNRCISLSTDGNSFRSFAASNNPTVQLYKFSTTPSITINPDVVNAPATGTQGVQVVSLTLTYASFEVVNYESFTVQFYDAQGQPVENIPAETGMVVGVTGTNAEGYQVSCAITDNTGGARSVYFKVYATVGEENVYSNLVTINQAAAPQSYTLTVSTLDAHITDMYVFNAADQNNPLIDDGQAGNATVVEGTEIHVSPVVEGGYILASLTVVDGDDSPVTTEDHMSDGGYYSFTMPASNVTISATTDVEPVVITYTLATTIDPGKHYIITNGDDKAMGYDKGNNRAAVDVTIANNVASVTDDAGVYEFIIYSEGNDTYSIYDETTKGYLYAAGSGSGKNYLRTQVELVNDGTWSISIDNDGVATVVAQGSNTNNNMRYNGSGSSKLFSCYSSGQSPIYLFQRDNDPIMTFTKTIEGYESETDKYYLIASPVVSIAPSVSNGFLTDDNVNDYDLYWFDQTQNAEWCNYKQAKFALVSGMGYLYASSNGGDLTFTGTPYSGDGTVSLVKDDDAEFPGWNLVGNPWGIAATIGSTYEYYVMNGDGNELEAGTDYTIGAMEGIFVIADNDSDELTFTPQTPNSAPTNTDAMVVMNVTSNRGTSIDRAIVRFGNGSQLPKFQLNPNHTKVYIPQGENDYAVVRSNAEGEMPVSFKAENNGNYTISVNAENVEMNYLHLIDNLTGADIDLLANPSYSFEAKTTDYASRFKLVFAANEEDGPSTSSGTFAFYNGSEWVVSNMGEATLQVVDMMGRVLSTETVSGNATMNTNSLSAGIYMMRLINGNDVKVQKIVVR